jgi:hypothetical protein
MAKRSLVQKEGKTFVVEVTNGIHKSLIKARSMAHGSLR